MVHLDITETSKAIGVFGGYVSIGGLVGFFLKERMYMSEALIAFLIGIAFGPIGANIFSPIQWAGGDHEKLSTLTFQITRIVIAIQVFFTGISLPKAYLWRERLSLCTLLIAVMTVAWFVSSLLVWGLIPGLTFLEALAIGACVTPTDPVLSNSICKGYFAEKYVPLAVRQILVAEAGANDGLGFPFLMLPVFLILQKDAVNPGNYIATSVGKWFYNTLFYLVLLSTVIGAVVGYIARKALRFAHRQNLIDHESFLSFGVALTLLTLAWVGTIGSDDIFCCFIVGNALNWDDWVRLEIEGQAFQEVVDQLLNSAIFLYIGAIMPWSEFGNFWDITPWRLVVLGILVMLLRRVPGVLALKRWIPTTTSWNEALFAGYFGPIGVGAIFYTHVGLELIPADGHRDRLRAVILPVVYFMVLTSIVVHGMSIPLGKGFQHVYTVMRARHSGANTAAHISRIPHGTFSRRTSRDITANPADPIELQATKKSWIESTTPDVTQPAVLGNDAVAGARVNRVSGETAGGGGSATPSGSAPLV